MADNASIVNTGGTPDPIPVSADDTPSGLVQRVKLVLSADGSDTHLTADASGIKVNLGTDNDVTIASLPALAAGSNNIGDVDVLTLPSIPAGTNAIGKLAANSGVDIGDVDVTSILPGSGATNLGKAVDAVAGASDIGVTPLFVREDTLSTLTPAVGDYARGKVDSAGAQYVQLAGALDASSDSVAQDARAGIGCDVYRNLDLNATKVQVKGAAATLYGWFIVNRATSPRYVKLWNSLSAGVTVGTTAATMTLEVPGSTSNHIGELVLSGLGIKFGTGLTVAATTGLLDSDSAAPSANDVVVHLFYK